MNVSTNNDSLHWFQRASFVFPRTESNLSAVSLEEYLYTRLGPKRLDMEVVIPITLAYTLIFVSGLIGNVCTCLVIVRNRHMHTATNYYLFNLAIADLLTLLLGLPNDLSVYWQQYPYFFGVAVCKIRAMVSEMTSYASVLTIVAFTTERYVAICHPFKAQKLSDLSRVIKTIAFLWIVACLSATPFAIFCTVNYVDYPAGSGNRIAQSAFCSIAVKDNHHNVPLFQFSTFAFFVIPLIVISVLYIKIAIKLRKSKMCRQISDSSSTSDGGIASRRAVLNILVAVVITFFVCWAPFHTQRLLVVYVRNNEWSLSLRKLNETLYHIAGCCYYINCTTNPILYNVMSKNYRKAFERTLYCQSRAVPFASRQSLSRLSTGSNCRFRNSTQLGSGQFLQSNLNKDETLQKGKCATPPAIFVINSSPDTARRDLIREIGMRQ